MSLCTVAELRSTLGVGTLYADATLQEVCDASDAVLLPMLWSDVFFNYAHSYTATVGTLYFDFDVSDTFYVGQTVVTTANGSHLNGSKTITVVEPGSISFAITGTPTPLLFHKIQPLGTVTCSSHVDWTADAAVQTAALEIAVDIWQSRQTSNSGGVSPDFQPSPYRMGNTLLARIRGLIAHALDPRSMVG